MTPQPRLGLSFASRPRVPVRTRSLFVTLAASAILLGAQAILAAAPPAQPASTHRESVPARQQPRAHARSRPARRSTPPAQAAPLAAPLPPAPAPPKPPDWPANNPPRPAAVVLNNQGLLIEANNSSLKQILNSVSAATGAKVEGLNSDERIFGSYGPGQVREVLSQLLDGSGYNVMIIGGQDRTTQLRIVLSAPPKGGASPAPNSPASSRNEDSAAQELPQPYQPQPPLIRNSNGPGIPPRTAQEIMQEMQQRQQEIQQREEQMREQQQHQN